MKRSLPLIACLLAAPAWGADVMKDCQPGTGSNGMQCVHRNGYCLEVEIDGQPTELISRAQKERLAAIPDTDEVCWQLTAPVSPEFRVTARGGGIGPEFVGTVEQIRALVMPIDDFDPKFDRRPEPLSGYELVATGDGSWRLQREDGPRTPGTRSLPAGEYLVVLRVYGTGNWERQGVLLRIDPKLAPALERPARAAKPGAAATGQSR